MYETLDEIENGSYTMTRDEALAELEGLAATLAAMTAMLTTMIRTVDQSQATINRITRDLDNRR